MWPQYSGIGIMLSLIHSFRCVSVISLSSDGDTESESISMYEEARFVTPVDGWAVCMPLWCLCKSRAVLTRLPSRRKLRVNNAKCLAGYKAKNRFFSFLRLVSSCPITYRSRMLRNGRFFLSILNFVTEDWRHGWWFGAGFGQSINQASNKHCITQPSISPVQRNRTNSSSIEIRQETCGYRFAAWLAWMMENG